MLADKSLREARSRVEIAFDRQEARVLDGDNPVELDSGNVRAAIDLDGAIARFRGLLGDRDV
jgi:hypothetical protein